MKFFKSKYKYHTKLTTLPIVQWGLLNESIDKREPLYQYLLVLKRNLELPKIPDKLKLKLMQTYEDLIYQIKSLDLTLKEYYRKFLYESVKLIHAFNKNNYHKISESDESLNINYDKCNDAFTKYLKYLSKNYQSFRFHKFQLRKDHLDHYFKIKRVEPNGQIKRLFEEAPAFLTLYQYIEKIKEISTNKVFLYFVTDIDFINQFYAIEEHEIKDIIWYDKLIKKQFITYGNYNTYIMERVEIFNLDSIIAKPNKEYDFYKELSRYVSYKKINIDEFTTSVAKYQGLLETAHQEAKQKEEPKPSNKNKQLSEHG